MAKILVTLSKMEVMLKNQGIDPRFLYMNQNTLDMLSNEVYAEMGVTSSVKFILTNVNDFDIIVLPWIEDGKLMLTHSIIDNPLAFETLR